MEGDTDADKIENHKLNIFNSLVTNVDPSLHLNTVSRTLTTVPTVPGEKLSLARNVDTSCNIKTFCGPTPTVTTPVQQSSQCEVASLPQIENSIGTQDNGN